MILVLTPNPALDKTAAVPGFAPGQRVRLPDVMGLAGGKGFNFARALRTLGGQALVIAPLAGHTGRLVEELARAEGLACEAHWIGGETRTCLALVESGGGSVTELNEAGPRLGAGDWDGLQRVVARRLPGAHALAVCGSLPAGLPLDALRWLVEQAESLARPVWLDTYGPLLAEALGARPALVKINQHEAGDLAGQPITGPAEALEAAAALRARGPQAVVITLGAQGAAGIDAKGQAFAWAAPAVRAVSAVGSGDAMFAGLAAGLIRGQPLSEAVKYGVAAGAANAQQIGAGVFSLEQVEAALREIQG